MSESTRTLSATPEQIESGKTMAIVSYLIFFIPEKQTRRQDTEPKAQGTTLN